MFCAPNPTCLRCGREQSVHQNPWLRIPARNEIVTANTESETKCAAIEKPKTTKREYKRRGEISSWAKHALYEGAPSAPSAFKFEKVNLHLDEEDVSIPSTWWIQAEKIRDAEWKHRKYPR
jgi:hypothetical protein